MNLLSKIAEFFRRQLLIAHIYGIPVRIDYRWFPVLLLMAWLMAQSIPRNLTEDILFKLFLGLVTSLVFFGSILIHELAHALAARMEKIDVYDIVLHPFGGLARFKRAPDNPRAEFRIAIAGPAASFILSLIFVVLLVASNSIGTQILSVLFFSLAFLNLLLAVFNLFPGYPLDGGRVLRAFLWKRGYELSEATILTGRAGQVIAVALIVFGFFAAFLRGDFFTGLWTIVVGIFLFDSAAGIIRQTTNMDQLFVREVMSPPVAIEPDSFVSHLIDNILPLYRQTAFPVAKDRQLYGIIALSDIKEKGRDTWHKTKAQDVMRPINEDYFVDTETLYSEARIIMRENGVGAVGVIDEKGHLVGFLQKGKIRRKK